VKESAKTSEGSKEASPSGIPPPAIFLIRAKSEDGKKAIKHFALFW
jgi:hypothetical protein